MNSSSPGESWREPYSYANNAGIGSIYGLPLEPFALADF